MAARVKKILVRGVALSPYARVGQEVEVDGNDPRVVRYLGNGVLEPVDEKPSPPSDEE